MNADNQQLRPVELGWMAAMFDAEGSIYHVLRQRGNGKQYHPTVDFTMTHPETIRVMHKLLEQAKIGHWVGWKEPTGYGKLPVGKILIKGLKRVYALLNLIEPIMVTKQEQAKLMQAWIQLRLSRSIQSSITEEETRIVNLIRELNTGKLNDYTLSTRTKHILDDRVCECGTLFTQKRYNQLYCSTHCRGKYQMQHYRAKI